MASMEDLVATISGGMHVGQQHDDLKDLHAKLAQTIHPTKAPLRPIPPPSTTLSPQINTGPLPPPAPASSWNDNVAVPLSNSNSWGGMGNSPRQGGFAGGTRQTGFAVPPPKSQGPQQKDDNNAQGGQQQMPYHTSVLPIRASPKDTGGFGDDAFKPLWEGKEQNQQQWSGFKGENR